MSINILKNKNQISQLFQKGETSIFFPLMLYSMDSKEPKVLFSISKKKISKAVERNKLKRQLKAIYAEDFSWNLNKHLAIVYIANYVCDTTEMKEAMQKIKDTYEKG
mgnify:FL=1